MLVYLNNVLSIVQNRYVPLAQQLGSQNSSDLIQIANAMKNDLQGVITVYQQSAAEQQRAKMQQFQLQQQLNMNWFQTTQDMFTKNASVVDGAHKNIWKHLSHERRKVMKI